MRVLNKLFARYDNFSWDDASVYISYSVMKISNKNYRVINMLVVDNKTLKQTKFIIKGKLQEVTENEA